MGMVSTYLKLLAACALFVAAIAWVIGSRNRPLPSEPAGGVRRSVVAWAAIAAGLLAIGAGIAGILAASHAN